MQQERRLILSEMTKKNKLGTMTALILLAAGLVSAFEAERNGRDAVRYFFLVYHGDSILNFCVK